MTVRLARLNAYVRFVPAISTDRRNTLFKFLCWDLVLQGLSWPLVELSRNGAQLGLAEGRHINTFGKVLPQKAVVVFVATPLPRGLWVAKIDVDLCCHRELPVLRHL